jgi:hypothetical protein
MANGITFAKPDPQNLIPRTVLLPKSAEAHPLDKLIVGVCNAARRHARRTGRRSYLRS